MQDIVTKKPRTYLPENFEIDTWENLEPFYTNLIDREISSKETLLSWLSDYSELFAVVSENYAWRFINKTRDTENEAYNKAYDYFVENIEPHRIQYANKLDRKFNESAYKDELDDERFGIYKKRVANGLDLFRTENIQLAIDVKQKANGYYSIAGAMTVEHEGKELTMQQAGALLEDEDRNLRQAIFEKTNKRRQEDRKQLHELFDELLKIRHQIALNAGFDNYRDYKLQELGRFDYGVAECEQFHQSVQDALIPLLNDLYTKRKASMNVEVLKPFDTTISLQSNASTAPFDGSEDLIKKSIDCLNTIDPYFGNCLSTMNSMRQLDLDSRKGKAPGGYNCPLLETGVPFIFMNAANTGKDVKTMVHEGGHAVHSFLMNDLEYSFDKKLTSEAAELASMSMEMFALDKYDIFYSNPEDAKSATYNFLEDVIAKIPWIALVDQYQHWLYTHPNHSHEERDAKWLELHKNMSSSVVDWSGYEDFRASLWQKQLHIFMVPFYYIEYGIAQLGAIGLWKNYKKNQAQTIAAYKDALASGYTAPLPKMYERAGVPFDFSKAHIQELGEFIVEQM